MTELIYSVSDFVAVFNQVVDTAFGSVVIKGELSNFKLSKKKWIYFDLKDEYSSIRFFGTVYQLPGPLEDGMVISVRGLPQLHPRFGFSVTIQSLQLSGEGTIKKAAQILEMKLTKEGLFDEARKRLLPYPPERIGLVTSAESAAYVDFVKILNQRWSGLVIYLYDVHVQGEDAPMQIMKGVEYFNTHNEPDVIAVIRGGGSADDLQAFNTEQVTRAIAASRVPTIVAIGHEVDVSLAELAADKRASTPSNAAELLTPDKKHEQIALKTCAENLKSFVLQTGRQEKMRLKQAEETLANSLQSIVISYKKEIQHYTQTFDLLNPKNVLKRGYAIVYQNDRVISSKQDFSLVAETKIQFKDGQVSIHN